VDNLANLPALKRIDLSSNHIVSLGPSVATLAHLTALDLSSNRITDLRQLGVLAGLRQLQSLSLRGNPVCAAGSRVTDGGSKDGGGTGGSGGGGGRGAAAYEADVRAMLPRLQYLDGRDLWAETNDDDDDDDDDDDASGSANARANGRVSGRNGTRTCGDTDRGDRSTGRGTGRGADGGTGRGTGRRYAREEHPDDNRRVQSPTSSTDRNDDRHNNNDLHGNRHTNASDDDALLPPSPLAPPLESLEPVALRRRLSQRGPASMMARRGRGGGQQDGGYAGEGDLGRYASLAFMFAMFVSLLPYYLTSRRCMYIFASQFHFKGCTQGF
jgi:hypothetical protein